MNTGRMSHQYYSSTDVMVLEYSVLLNSYTDRCSQSPVKLKCAFNPHGNECGGNDDHAAKMSNSSHNIYILCVQVVAIATGWGQQTSKMKN